MIDADVHCAPSGLTDLYPYLDRYWQEYIDGSGLKWTGMPSAYPPGSPISGGLAPATYEALRSDLLDRDGPATAILNCLTIFETHRNPYYSAALATAVNDWLRAEWLDRDDRLRASMVVPFYDVDSSLEEIERLAGDKRFVQILLPTRVDSPLGKRRYHRIYEAAVANGLVVGLHAWGRPASAPTANGLTLTHLEDYVSNIVIVQQHVLSLVSEGVFDRFPELHVSLLECGFAWLPSLLWRWDKDWRSLWREVPWVKEKPSAYVLRNFRATTAPAHLPQAAKQIAELVEMIGPRWLLYASDHPHDHGASADGLFAVLDDGAARAVRGDNAAAFYPRLAA
jgi:predicted TIM-barrel fold metal-dependent hydrolase